MVGKLRKLAKSQCIFLLLIIFLGLILRLYKINNPVADWHSFRQADTASVGRLYAENGIDLLEPRYHDISTTQSGTFNPEGYRFVEFPLFSLFHSEFYKLYSSIDFDVWGRFVSIFSAAISTYLIFLLGKKYIGFVGGLLASLFYAVLPFNVYFTRVILPEPLAVTLGLAGLWFLSKNMDLREHF
jgi:Gpi18-like mannosyltransferase